MSRFHFVLEVAHFVQDPGDAQRQVLATMRRHRRDEERRHL